jgi:type IV pilus assembly protein PilY1
VGDVAVIAVANAAVVDHAYAADTGGNIYRIDFASSVSNWVINQVAYTTGSGRKFQYAPALLPNSGKVYLALGSGDREHPLSSHYPFTSPVTNRFYVYLDDLSASPADKAHAVNLDDASLFSDFSSNPSCGSTTVLPSSSQKGWRPPEQPMRRTSTRHRGGVSTVGGMFRSAPIR